MKKIFFFILTIISLTAFAQPSKIFIRGDSVYIQSASNAEVILLNGSRNLQYGYLQNIGNGRTKFHYALDSVWVEGDSLVFRYGPGTLKVIHGGGGGGTTYAAGYGLNLSSTTFKVDTANVSTKLWRQKGIDSILGLLSSNYYTQTQINSFFGGTTPIGGYNKTNWDLAFSWGNHAGLYPTISRFMDSVAALRADIGGGSGIGDMTKAVYDTDNDGYIDNAVQKKDSAGIGYATFKRLYKVRDSLVNAYTVAIAAMGNIYTTNGTLTSLRTVSLGSYGLIIQQNADNKTTIAPANFNTYYDNGTRIGQFDVSPEAGVYGQSTATSEFGAYSSFQAKDSLILIGGHNTSGFNTQIILKDSYARFKQTSGNYYFDNLAAGASTDSMVVWNPATKRFGYKTPGGGSSVDTSLLVHKTGDETIADIKTFTSPLVAASTVSAFSSSGFSGSFLTQMGGTSVGADTYGAFQFGNSVNSNLGTLYTDVLTATRTYKLPNRSGTIALREDIADSLNTYRASDSLYFDETQFSGAGTIGDPIQVIGGSGGSSFPTQQDHTTGATVTVTNQTTDIWLAVNPASTLSTLTITLPATPVDGQKIEISFGGTLTSGDVVTALTVSPNTGHTLLQASSPSSVAAGETISYRYKSSNSKWYRL